MTPPSRGCGSWGYDGIKRFPPMLPRDPDALGQLHAQYGVLRASGIGASRWQPWTREAALTLGRLFVAAYGAAPPSKHLARGYSMPEASSIRRLFGTLQDYWAALEEEDATP